MTFVTQLYAGNILELCLRVRSTKAGPEVMSNSENVVCVASEVNLRCRVNPLSLVAYQT